MKKFKQLTSVILALTLSLTAVTSFAHSGRTDASGGHRDNKNASGLGSYHYHCGGYPAHLHNNGVCPYQTRSTSKTTTTVKTPATTKTYTPPSPKIVSTYFKTFINGYEIPTFSHSKNGGAYVIVEDLVNYGFNVTWDSSTQTVHISLNNNADITPMDMSYYRNLKNGQTVFNIKTISNAKVALIGDGYSYSPTAYDCGGYMAISADELKMFGDWSWNSYNNSITLNTK